MSSLKDNFNELMERIRQGRELGPASFEPVYYLIFDPQQILEVKRQMPAWIARLRNEGWQVETFSIARNIEEILTNSPLRKIWLEGDKRAPLDWKRTSDSLANALNNGSLQMRLEECLEKLESKHKGILLVTDLEALHPYLRIGAIENQLHGKFSSPTVFLYPGQRTGKTQLKFLGFYSEDGNYRSVHVGG
jgi:hypothetical protein